MDSIPNSSIPEPDPESNLKVRFSFCRTVRRGSTVVAPPDCVAVVVREILGRRVRLDFFVEDK
jgi:hypothetical protein